MEDYSAYSYSKLLKYLDERGSHNGEGRKYTDYLLSMGDAESIDGIIEIYNNVFRKIADLIFHSALPREWYHVATWNPNDLYLAEELNQCLNENILRLYKAQQDATDSIGLTCLANLREAKNADSIHNELTALIGKADDKNHSQIAASRKVLSNYCAHRVLYEKKTHGYALVKANYCEAKSILVRNNFINSIIETCFEEELGITMHAAEIHVDNPRSINWANIWVWILLIIIFVAVIGIIHAIVRFIQGDGIDKLSIIELLLIPVCIYLVGKAK